MKENNRFNITPAALGAFLAGDLDNFVTAATPGGIEAQEKAGQTSFVAAGPDAQTPSETPLTDALLLGINEGRTYGDDGPLAEFAHQLERKNADLRRRLHEFEITDQVSTNFGLQQENADLRGQLTEAQRKQNALLIAANEWQDCAETAEAELKRISPFYTAACIGQRDAEAALATEQLRCKVAEERRDALSSKLAEAQVRNAAMSQSCDETHEQFLRMEQRAEEWQSIARRNNWIIYQRAIKAEQERDNLTRLCDTLRVAVAKECDTAADIAREEAARMVGSSTGITSVHECAAAIRSSIADPAAVKRTLKDAARLQGLRELCGYFQDGSDVTVRLYQDDACGSYHINVGKRHYFDEHSWFGALDAAIDAARKGEEVE